MNIVFTAEQASFISEGLGLPVAINESVHLNRNKILEIREYAEGVEIDEALKMDKNGDMYISDRGQIACEILDMMSSALREANS
jgi:hypothetical protein